MSYKILVVGPSWVGDMVMAQSLFKLLQTEIPKLQIDVLAPAWTFSLLSCMPEVHQAIELPIAHGEFKLTTRLRLAKKLRQERYDQAIVLPNSWKSALIPYFARIPKRTGWFGEWRLGLLNDARKLDKKRYPLMVEQYLALGLTGGMQLPMHYPHPEFIVTQHAKAAVLQKFKPLWRERPIIGLCPGGEFGPSKRWPETYFAEIANEMISKGWDVWLFGSPKDKIITDRINSLTESRCENLAGKPLLSETIALLSLTAGILTHDSGLMHIAAALKKPLIALYGSTSPAFTPPLYEKAQILQLDLPCQPCFKRTCPLLHHDCMQQLLPAQVVAAMQAWEK